MRTPWCRNSNSPDSVERTSKNGINVALGSIRENPLCGAPGNDARYSHYLPFLIRDFPNRMPTSFLPNSA